MGAVALPESGRIYIDAQVLIYSVEARAPYSAALRPLWMRAQHGALEVVTSELTLLEVLVRPLREGRADLVEIYRGALDGERLALRPVSEAVLLAAARLRAAVPALRTPDAIHAATALQEGCCAFVSNDHGFRQLSDLPLILLSEVVAEGEG